MNVSAAASTKPSRTDNSSQDAEQPAGLRAEHGELSDEELVTCVRQGDESALEELLGRHEEKLFQLAMRFVPNEHDAQEILQDVFLTTWRKLPSFEGRAQIGTWLYRVTVNAALMFLRARSRRPPMAMAETQAANVSDPMEFAGFGPNGYGARTPDDQLQSAELHWEIQKAVEELPAGLRTVFFERLVEGRSTRQTAQSLGLSAPVVRTRLHRARVLLRANMEGYLGAMAAT